MSLNVNRRDLLRAVPGGVAILAILDRLILDLGAQEDSQENIIDIRIVNTYRIGRWYFDPVGVYLKPGQKVRWICTKWGGSVTAFHPSPSLYQHRRYRGMDGAIRDPGQVLCRLCL